MNRLFWSLVILDAGLLWGPAIFLILSGVGPFVLDSVFVRAAAGVSILLALAALVYQNTQSPGIHRSLLILAAMPLLVGAAYGINYLHEAAKERHIAQYNDGRLQMFGGDAQTKRFVLAVYEQDSSKVRELSPKVNINAVSTLNGYTPLKLAVERAAEAEAKPEADRALEMVRLLLSLGAKPNSGLHAACRSSRADLVRMLLDAGADPNNLEPGGTGPPAFYGCFGSPTEAAGLENLRLMKDKGANFTLKGDWLPAIPFAVSNGLWETVLYLHDSGVPLREDRDGGWIARRVQEDLAAAKEPSEALKRVAELLKQ
jgi:hypothetical protein